MPMRCVLWRAGRLNDAGLDIAGSTKQGEAMKPQSETSALKVWLQLLALLTLIAVLGYGMLWIRRHFH